ncbi:MAG: glycosyltransferase family 4 protein [bacterium]|nr:glycosyltransferase family 4 protein [bacterium]
MKYCFVAGNYPTKTRQVHVFLENIVTKLVDKGEVCTVIAPQSYVAYFFKRGIRRDIVSERATSNGNKYTVYSPLYFVLPKIKIGELSTLDLQRWIIYKVLKRTYKKNDVNADLIYSHFVRIGMSGVRLAKELGIPSFIANGEADTYAEIKMNSKSLLKQTLKDATGIISVSTKNKNEIAKLSGNDPKVLEKTSVIVNAADNNRFYRKDKIEIRKRMEWPLDAFVIAFTGSFIERKGVKRLSRVVDRFDDVYSIFMGVGEEKPTCKNILHCGRVNNADMNDYLNAADIFVLPTQAEGCSNAIVEAILCGLPVISSDKEFNYDVLDETCSILIDPNSDEEIYQAIKKLKEDTSYREKLRDGAIERSKRLNLNYRVEKIQCFIKSKMN